MAPVDERPIRRAASAVCVRPATGGFEVLVVQRSAASRFLPGYIAFPGGAVDAGDEARAERWFGDAAHAPRAAAVRELVEEVGLTLTAAGLVAAVDLAPTDDAPPAADQISPLCHWIAPPDVPVRFDARYFTIEGDGVEPRADDAEIARTWWVDPRALLEEWRRGEHKLYWPTWYTLTQVARCATASEAMALSFASRDPTQHEEDTMPLHVMEQV
jgi:8-oxo-dGTP pyrophosphatase MutT (NUDIX family)